MRRADVEFPVAELLPELGDDPCADPVFADTEAFTDLEVPDHDGELCRPRRVADVPERQEHACDFFAAFLTRRDLRGEDPAAEIEQHIILTKLVVDGEDRDFLSRSLGFAGVNVTIVWHPGWPIQHAQVDAGRAVRLRPDPDEVDFGAVPQVPPKELALWDGSIGSILVTADEFARIAQRPLSVDSDPFQAFFGSIAGSEP
ncbi:hypothetical protein M3147_17100 [Agromyces mediolanus]|uniref:hypothetical protein n=1 Tax=Agromyces mediolanus TaxID=41986 RepID=UPI00203BE54D|nr:hypothetical protein [Agromyces mediolanus]MCM3658977.1 hypothetical protein [Agromyces mediolanus]